jgi:hypothetical protein
MSRTLVGFALLLSLWGCGGSSQSAAEPAAPQTPAPRASEADSEQDNVEAQRASFMKVCSSRTPSREFCECGFEVFKEVFAGTDTSKPLEPDDPRVQQLQQQTSARCASKLSEEDVRQGFMLSCAAGVERKLPYCECAWSSMRKSLQVLDFVGVSADDPRFVEPKTKMVVECKGKFPPDAFKAEFMQACLQSEDEPVCACKLKKLTQQFSTEELVAGTADFARVKGLDACK